MLTDTAFDTREAASRVLARFDERVTAWTFVPHGRFRGGHAQTIASALWRRTYGAVGEAHEDRFLPVADGSRVRLRIDWQHARRGHPTALLVHGLEGSDASRYMLGTADKFLAAGWNTVRMNVRNCGDTERLTPTLYHSGMTDDLHEVLRYLLDEEQVPLVGIVGFSLGGNMTMNLAGELGKSPPPELLGLATVSPAIDLAASADRLEEPRNIIYQRRFVRSIRKRLERKAAHFPGVFDLSRLRGMRTVRDYDDRYIAPLFGFRDAADYYERASARESLGSIGIPTLLLHALDDPFIPLTDRVRTAASANPLLRIVTTPRGGHVGWLGDARNAALAGEDRHWAENRVVEFLSLCAENRIAARV